MPVGMTLQQLYSQPTYHSDVVGSGALAVPSSAAAVSSAIATSAVMAPGATSAGSTAKRPPSINISAPLPPRASAVSGYADHHASVAMPPHYASLYGQLPPPHSYTQYHQPKPQDEYGLADPLPFEYMGLRKGDVPPQDHRYAAASAPYAGSYSAHSPHPSVYESQHVHPPKAVEDRAYHQPTYAPPHHGADRAYHAMPEGLSSSSHFQAHTSMPAPLYATSSAMVNSLAHTSANHHSFPPLLDTQNLKKETTAAGGEREPQAYSPHGPAEYAPAPVSAPGGASQEAVIKVKTPLKAKYWRNGRRNLQCFPSCKVFGDYSSIKIEDLKQHDFMWGKCRGSLITEVTLNSSVSFDDILILGRVHSLENMPVAFEEAVIRECMLGRMVEPDVMDGMKDQWITGERLPDFVQQDGNTACYEFKPKVWKYTEDMTQGKCKRRNVKYYVQFEAFVLVMSGERRYYACIGSGMSTAFEVGSSRVLARQKRKASSGLDANPLYVKPGQAPPGQQGSPAESMNPTVLQQQQQQQQHPMMAPHSMMAPHAMHSQMYPPAYAPQGYPPPRGLAPPPIQHPSMMSQMHHADAGASFGYHPSPVQQQLQQALAPQQQQSAPASAPSAGQKRKASGGGSSERAIKAKKAKEAASSL